MNHPFCRLLVFTLAAAFQQGKLPNNPFQGGAPGAPGAGAMVPPPANMGGKFLKEVISIYSDVSSDTALIWRCSVALI